MEENTPGIQYGWRFGKGFIFVVIFLIILLSFFFVFRFKSTKNRIDTSSVKKTTAGESAGTVFATGEDMPSCIKLSANPTLGGARLLVTFVAEGSAVNGVVRNFEFNFGDEKKETVSGAESKGISTALVTHLYEKPGTYTATVRVQDVFGKWSELTNTCKQVIKVEGSVLGR